MSYYRAMRAEELSAWLDEQIVKNNLIGDNQLDVDKLVQLMIQKFDVLGNASTPV